MKDIVIIANFCRDFSETDNGRFMYLCKELSRHHRVEIITSNFSHAKKIHKEPLKVDLPFTVTFLNEPGYKKNISLKRFYSHNVWGRAVKKYLNNRKKPDVVYCAVPSLTGPLNVAKYCEKHGIKFIVDIQDLWPEAFKMIFNIPLVSNIIFKPFDILANGIYKRADVICAVSSTYSNRAMLVNRKCQEGHPVFLGTNLDTFDSNVRNNPVNKPENELWLGYCGTLGASYDLTCVFDALDLIRNKGVKTPKFIIMGDGPRKGEFENYAKEKKLDVVFTGALPYDRMCGMLCACDMTVNPISRGTAASIINKHGDYAASGLPVLNTQESQEYIELVDAYRMGLNCKAGDAVGLAENMLRLIEDDALRLEMGKNARLCAEEKFDRKHSYDELVKVITE